MRTLNIEKTAQAKDQIGYDTNKSFQENLGRYRKSLVGFVIEEAKKLEGSVQNSDLKIHYRLIRQVNSWLGCWYDRHIEERSRKHLAKVLEKGEKPSESYYLEQEVNSIPIINPMLRMDDGRLVLEVADEYRNIAIR